ncbi:MAG: DUF58 domain-containing protein [Anaerolineales bacterium]|jgi:uncharacterized protein (DUF58 family)
MAPERWLPFLAAIFLIGAIFDINFLTTVSATVAILITLTYWWRNHALDDVIYRRRPHFRRAFPGENVPLQLEVENRKPLPLSWLRAEDPWPHAVAPVEEDALAPSHLPDQGLLTNVFNLRWFEKTRRQYNLHFRRRGVYRIGPTRLQSGDVFGMYEISTELDNSEYLTVFPKIEPREKLDLPADDPFGDQKSDRRIFEDPTMPMGVREYHPEDGFRHIHWPATARTGELQVKVYQPTSALVTMVCINTSTFERHWEGVYPELLEHIISVSATLVSETIKDGYQVGLLSNGCLAHADRPLNIRPSRSPKQLGYLLEALAGITPMVMVPFESFLLREMPRVPYGASLLVVSAVTAPTLMGTLQRIKQHNRRITLLSLAEQAPELVPGITLLHRPYNPEKDVVQ